MTMKAASSNTRTPEAAESPGEGRRAAALYGVYEISKVLTTPERLETTLSTVMALLASFLDMRHGLIALLDDQGDPETVIGAGCSDAVARNQFDRLPERAIGQIVVTKMPLVVNDVTIDPRFVDWEPPPAGRRCYFIGVPVRDRDRVIGTLTIDQDYDEHAVISVDETVRFLTMVANLLGQTVRLQRLIRSDRERLVREQRRLEKALETRTGSDRSHNVNGILGESEAIRAVLNKIRIVAPSNSWVLLRGESGTGKELFAQAIHSLSGNKNAPFVKLNCAALPESVLESELFGHEKGAFTGAVTQRKGRFELADGGTLFLDEIGEISPAFQAKLLRVLQEGEFERVGGTRTLKVNFRLVAATNRNLEDAVRSGEFRADLYYRISIIPITLPPLRERPGDITILAREFLYRFNQEHGKVLNFSDEGMAILTACCFPGNVRELENCVRHTATLAGGTQIVADDFACRHDSCLSSLVWRHPGAMKSRDTFIPLPILGSVNTTATVAADSAPRPPRGAAVPQPPIPDGEEIHSALLAGDSDVALTGDDDPERARLIDALEKAGWVQAKAARLLGLTPRQIGYALLKHRIPIKRF
ncbi:MAG: nif-specific transcriptional activator NifA [Azospirillaceae bacterium]|nr:nif-specific transcriptional activator NifA [Azospirillaceae bacterium]